MGIQVKSEHSVCVAPFALLVKFCLVDGFRAKNPQGNGFPCRSVRELEDQVFNIE